MLYFIVRSNLDQVATRRKVLTDKILEKMLERSKKSTNILKDAERNTLRGKRSGRIYRYNGGYYQASAPGEAPAKRSGAYRDSFVGETLQNGNKFTMRIESDLSVGKGYILGQLLENGTSRMAPRPHREKIQSKALPKIKGVFRRKYL